MDGIPLDLDGAPLGGQGSARKPRRIDIDGMPLMHEDLDGMPFSDVDGMPCKFKQFDKF